MVLSESESPSKEINGGLSSIGFARADPGENRWAALE